MSGTSVSAEFYPPTFVVEINGARIDPLAAYSIRSLEVQEGINRASAFSLAVQDDVRDGQFTWIGHTLFKVGNTVRISVGYGGDNVVIGEGKIQNINAQFTESGHPSFTVEGAGDGYQKLTVPSAMYVFKEKSLRDVVARVAQLAGADPEIDVGDENVPISTKRGGYSYFDFLKELARDGHYDVEFSAKKLWFGTPRQDREPIMTLEWGQNLISFNPTLNTSRAVSAVVVRAWDKKRKEAIDVRVSPGDEMPQESRAQLSSRFTEQTFGEVVRVITNRPLNSVDDARKLGKAALNKLSENLIRGSATTVGLPQLRPGICLRLKSVGTWTACS